MAADETDIYNKRESEFEELLKVYKRGEHLTKREFNMVTCWAEAQMKHAHYNPDLNTPVVKRQIIDTFNKVFEKTQADGKPAKRPSTPPPSRSGVRKNPARAKDKKPPSSRKPQSKPFADPKNPTAEEVKTRLKGALTSILKKGMKIFG